ncbi:MAG: HWE histidine kinase domain-containing protein [Caulobacteraceae bacterium]|nr:HWE histidine kinase domain-containing protein [Caulobacteraceae bacterium]
MSALTRFFDSAGFLPHGYCLLWRPDLLALHALSDLLIACAYFSIPLAIMTFVRRRSDLAAEHKRIAILFSTFILACGMTHVMGLVVLWRPLYALDGGIKAFTAVISIMTAALLWPVIPRLLALPSTSQLAAINGALRAEVSAKLEALAALDAIRGDLETQVQRRTHEVEALARRFEIATAGSRVTVSEQDDQLRYTWLHNPRAPLTAEAIGRSDLEAMVPDAAAVLEPLKRRALGTGLAATHEVILPLADGPRHFEMFLTPTETADGVRGLLTAWVDITEQKRQHERMQVIVRELAHRAKNVLALIEGLARQSVKAENLPEAVIIRFSAKLAALGAAHDLLLDSDWQGIELRGLVEAQLAHIMPEPRVGVTIEGPSVMLGPEAGQYLALALHELATNAAKFGRLGQAGETDIRIAWTATDGMNGEKYIDFNWIERGSPIAPPARRGFGRLLLETILPRALRGASQLEFGEAGLSWRVSFTQELRQFSAGL